MAKVFEELVRARKGCTEARFSARGKQLGMDVSFTLPSKVVTGKRPAKSEKKASSRNLDDGWIVARSLIDGRSTSW